MILVALWNASNSADSLSAWYLRIIIIIIIIITTIVKQPSSSPPIHTYIHTYTHTLPSPDISLLLRGCAVSRDLDVEPLLLQTPDEWQRAPDGVGLGVSEHAPGGPDERPVAARVQLAGHPVLPLHTETSTAHCIDKLHAHTYMHTYMYTSVRTSTTHLSSMDPLAPPSGSWYLECGPWMSGLSMMAGSALISATKASTARCTSAMS